jgi:hypothetical protein
MTAIIKSCIERQYDAGKIKDTIIDLKKDPRKQPYPMLVLLCSLED